MADDYSEMIRKLETQVRELEMIQQRASSLEAMIEMSSDSLDLQDIISRINRVQDLVDNIEIEVDKLEMGVSSIEHVGFRLRTGGQ
ncbi:MAG: hypothetical protein ACFFF9_06365 [Candidatus Thorarchaeota archaeon]